MRRINLLPDTAFRGVQPEQRSSKLGPGHLAPPPKSSVKMKVVPMRAFMLIAVACAAIPATCLAQTQNESFDLSCSASDSAVAPHTLHIDVDADGAVAIAEKDGSVGASHQAQTYVNAYLWDADGVRYIVDRFTGVLSTKPAGQRWQCSKVGGRKF